MKEKLSFLADLCYNWAYVFKIEKVRKLNADRINDRRSRENRWKLFLGDECRNILWTMPFLFFL